MVIKTYLKTLLKMFRRHIARFISLVAMVVISIGFVSGIGSAADKIDYSLDNYYRNQNVSDFIIKSKSATGFTDEEINNLRAYFEGADIDGGMSIDLPVNAEEKLSLRLYFLDFENWTVNTPALIDGKAPETVLEAYCEQSDDVIKGFSVGEEVDLSPYGFALKVKISGVIQSPLTFNLGGEPSYNNPENAEFDPTIVGTDGMDCLENIIYIDKALLPVPTGDLYVAISDRSVFNRYSAGYIDYVTNTAETLEAEYNVKVITLADNYSFISLDFYSEKVLQIGYILMVAFLLVTALVALSNMTRLIDEERSQIACLTTLGYSPFGIISKYILFAMIATGIGAFVAYFVNLGLSHFIYFVFNYSFYMPAVSNRIALVFYLINVAFIAVATIGATVIAGFKMTGEKPADMLRPRPPKAGKKVLLERIPLIWNRLPFKYKSTVRNVFRYKSRFIMTVIAVAVSMALVMAGLALLDLCLFGGMDSSAIEGVAVLIVIFAGLLTVTVLYTLMKISISERNREIATLMVLGYKNGEVAGYMYREIYINVGVGLLFGYPVSALLVWFLLDVIVARTMAELSWFIWLIAPVIVMLFTGLVTLILYRRIVKVDMNESLKAIE